MSYRDESVSMPPRRSCFSDPAGGAAEVEHGFNATTAFLLRRGPLDRGGGAFPFQCHHGVPASREHDRERLRAVGGFNATTAFLLPAEEVTDVRA